MNEIPECLIGLPGGSGTWACLFPESLNRQDAQVVSYYPQGFDTPYGQSAPVKVVRIGDANCLTFAMHGWHLNHGKRIPSYVCAQQVAHVMKEAGVRYVLLSASVGGIQNPDKPGKPLGPWSVGPTTDVISPWAERGEPFWEGSPYPRMAQPTCPSMNELLIAAAQKQPKLQVYSHGIYIGTDRRLETAAEIAFFRQIGGTIVGQTFQHEFGTWRQLNFHVGELWIVSNHAEGGAFWTTPGGDYDPETWDTFYRECAPICGHVLVDTVLTLISSGYTTKCNCYQFAGSASSGFPVDVPANWPGPKQGSLL